jgi:1-acyl-sn-glycerol-3-phosphate acyltransferase
LIAVRSVIFAALFYLWSALTSFVMIPLFLCPRRWTVKALAVWGLGCIVLLRLACGIRVELRGREHIPKGSAIVAPKHQCMFDVFVQFAWLSDVCFVMKKELLKVPFFGWYAWKGGMIPVDRGGHSAALKKLVRDAKARLKVPRQLLIFPEGTRRLPGAPGDYKPGIAALYRELDLPVHPVATNSGVHWPAHGLIRTPGTIVFEFLEPIPPGLKRAEFMRTLEDRIETAQPALATL